jgi:16S rRNA (cytosine1402-N4)-methyltransferase
MLREVLEVLAPQPGEVVADCTLGFGGHAVPLLQRVGPGGRLIALDRDPENLPKARELLAATGLPFALHHTNFAALPRVLAEAQLDGVDVLLADLGMSSLQLDDPERGFSYVRPGPLDMRMDRSRGQTASELLTTISAEHLARALREFGDEPDAERLAQAIVAARETRPLQTTAELADVIAAATRRPATRGDGWRLRSKSGAWQSHPAARTFQALRILVNRELASLEELLRVLPNVLRPGGRAAIITFHSGEDRLVKHALRAGQHAGVYKKTAEEPLRPAYAERLSNPRSRSAKLRWARRAST